MDRANLVKSIWQNKENLDFDTLQKRLKAFSRMLPLVIKGEYKPKNKSTIIIGIGAILYAVSPLDFIPDFIPFGLLDDFVILGYGVKKVNEEILRFLDWEDQQRDLIMRNG